MMLARFSPCCFGGRVRAVADTGCGPCFYERLRANTYVNDFNPCPAGLSVSPTLVILPV